MAEEEVVADWTLLSEELGPEAYEALRKHLANQADEKDDSTDEEYDATAPAAERAGQNVNFTKQEYWDERFASEAAYDWLVNYEDVRKVIEACVPSRAASILEVGCGNSGLQQAMRDDGYTDVLSTDFSEVCIKAMQARSPHLRFAVADVTTLAAFADGAFDAVLDKGCMDALVAAEGDCWDPSEDAVEAAHAMCKAVSRVLRPGGVFVQISFAQPHFRRKYLLGQHAAALSGDSRQQGDRSLSLYQWDVEPTVEIQKESGCLGHFVYVARKLPALLSPGS